MKQITGIKVGKTNITSTYVDNISQSDSKAFTVTASKPNHTSKANGIQVIIKPVTLTDLVMELNAYEVAYGSSTTVNTVTATYSNGATKSVLDNATYSSNPTGIVTIS